jgi:hypothetical protein
VGRREHRHDRSTGAAEPQFRVGIGTESFAECFAILLIGPANHSAFQLPDIAGVDLDPYGMSDPDMSVDKICELLAGQTFTTMPS